MAIISCVECGQEISDRAHVCPKCEYPYIEDKHIGENHTHENEVKRTFFATLWMQRHTLVGIMALVTLLLIAVSFFAAVLTDHR